MTAQTIRALVPLLPQGAAYPAADQPAASRLQQCLFDPQFPWHFVRTFVEAGQPLPLEVRDVVLRKAWTWQRHRKPNAVLDEAYELKHPANHATAELLHALLICPDLSLEKIAELLGLPVAVVTAYETLFFNVRDRLQDKVYLARLVYPASRYPDLFVTPEIPVPAQQLLQAAYEYGSEEVLYMAGLLRKRERADIRTDYTGLETAIVDNATILARHGGLNRKEAPGLNHARSLLLAQKRTVAEREELVVGEQVGLTNIGTALYDEMLAEAPEEIREMLRAGRAAAHQEVGLPLETSLPAAKFRLEVLTCRRESESLKVSSDFKIVLPDFTGESTTLFPL